MARILQHVIPEGANNCTICGATTAQTLYSSYPCIWRDVPDPRTAAVRPEPALRDVACEDASTISRRLADLARERTEAMNTVSE